MPDPSSCTILYSTQTGRAKACARRTARILTETTGLRLVGGSTFDEVDFVDLATNCSNNSTVADHFFLFFVSTTGDGVHCDSIQKTWKSLLKKSLAPTTFQGSSFALFCLGDRAYGPQFCAAGRKLAVRLMQLGMKTKCEVGYGDDNTPNGGVFADLDRWIQQQLLQGVAKVDQAPAASSAEANNYSVTMGDWDSIPSMDQWCQEWCRESYQAFFAKQSPMTAYTYHGPRRAKNPEEGTEPNNPLVASVESNERLTAPNWDQNTRHLRLRVAGDGGNLSNGNMYLESELPYRAGDIAAILPCNPPKEVDRFIQTLPTALKEIIDRPLVLDYRQKIGRGGVCLGGAHPHWPKRCTLRGWLTFCADIHAPPEREDLRALSQFCSPNHDMFEAQRDKLISLSETSASALYVDYILREKRCWTDVLYDFDSLRDDEGSKLTVEALLMLLPPIRPREFSIASSPSQEKLQRQKERQLSTAGFDNSFCIELCVAVVEGTTPLGRKYNGLCSHYLSQLSANHCQVRLWIRPGSFAGPPLRQLSKQLGKQQWFENPLLCIGAGTGVAPLRSLILEREAVKQLSGDPSSSSPVEAGSELDQYDNILVFGCRQRDADYYYQDEWNLYHQTGRLFILPAFSREQARKVYVQQLIRANGSIIMKHILENDGAIYIAGNPSMARYSKEELVEAAGRLLDGDEKKANVLLKKLQARGRFSVEAWS